MTLVSIPSDPAEDRRRILSPPRREPPSGPADGPQGRLRAGRAALAGLRPAGRGVLHDHRGPHDRQRGPADHRGEAALSRVRPAVGGHRLRPDLRRLPAPRRAGRRPARSPTPAHGGPGRLLRGVPCVWVGHLGHLPDHHARVPGPRGGHRPAGRPLHRDEHVPRGRRAQQGSWHLGRHGRHGGHGRSCSPAACSPATSVGSTSSSSTCPSGRLPWPWRPRSCPRAGCAGAASLRPIRGGVHHLGAGGARLCHLAGVAGWLGRHPDRRHAHRGGGSARGVLRHRDPGRGTTAAAAPVPPEHRCRIQRRWLLAHRRASTPSSSSAPSTCSRCSASQPSRPDWPG